MKKRVLICVVILGMILVGGAAALRYQTAFRKTLITEVSSDDGKNVLKLYRIGEPEFPFGSVTCEAILFRDGKRVRSESFRMANDGKNPDESSFTVVWSDTAVTVTVHPEEADDETLVFPLE